MKRLYFMHQLQETVEKTKDRSLGGDRQRNFWNQETLIYMAVWGLLFAAPLLSLYVHSNNKTGDTFYWTDVFFVWRKFALYFILFIIHNYLLAPLIVNGRRRVAYFSFVAVILVLFTVYQCNTRPGIPPKFDDGGIGMKQGPKPQEGEGPGFRDEGDGPGFREHPDNPENPEIPGNPENPEIPGNPDNSDRPDHRDGPGFRDDGDGPGFRDDGDGPGFRDDGERYNRPPDDHGRDNMLPIIGEHDIVAVVVLILMFAANLGIKGYYRSRYDRKRLEELEKENLEQQLEYLRYQINPHFFMNTLNNIHALVDIDPAKAQETILELSKMMRFVLYEGDKKGVPLTKEMDFIRNYVKLMQLRYTDKVRIALDLPQEVPDRSVPPLVFVSFIENAFKHGISYQRESFVEISVTLQDDKLHFTCRNSKPLATNASQQVPREGGVGLVNVRKRLDLLYGNTYSLLIDDGADVYTIALVLPLPPNL